jgi:predicted O-methyltransferase YrrM
MKFSQDWFTENIPNFEACAAKLPSNSSFLEIGSFEGMSTCWMLQNMLSYDGELVCVDTFDGGDEYAGIDLSDLRTTFDSNVEEAADENQSIEVLAKTSWEALSELVYLDFTFDFIYLDGSHKTPEVLLDACLAFKLLEPKGVMLFDDYGGGAGVGAAVDAFLEAYKGQYKVILKNYQLAIQKT